MYCGAIFDYAKGDDNDDDTVESTASAGKRDGAMIAYVCDVSGGVLPLLLFILLSIAASVYLLLVFTLCILSVLFVSTNLYGRRFWYGYTT